MEDKIMEDRLMQETENIFGRLRMKLDSLYLRVKRVGQEFLEDNAGMGTVEIILIILVLIGLVVIFKSGISAVVNNIITKIGREAAGV